MPLGYDFSALRSTLGSRNFAVFTAGNAVSLIGTWTQRVAVGWVTWDLTHSAAWLGAVAMAEFLPVIVMAPVTGVMTDRFDRRKIAIIGQCLATLQAAALAGFTISGHITPLLVLCLQLIGGIIQPVIQTARLSLVPTLVPRENAGHAVAVTSLCFNSARIIGPALSGILIAAVGAGYSFAFNAASYLFVISALTSLKLPPHLPAIKQHVSLIHGIWTDFGEGWRYTFAHRTLKWVIPTISTACLLTWPVGDLLAGIADREFGRSVGGLAAFTSAQGFGAICGALFLAQRKGGADIDLIFARSVLLNGICVAIFAVTKNFWVAVPLFALNGVFMVIGGAGSQTVIHSHVVEHMRGRTLSIWYMVTRVAMAVGGLLMGTLSALFGFTWPIFGAGVVTACIALGVLWRRPKDPPPAPA